MLDTSSPVCFCGMPGDRHEVMFGSQSVVCAEGADGLAGETAVGVPAMGCGCVGAVAFENALASSKLMLPLYMPMPQANRSAPTGCAGRSSVVSPVSDRISWIPKLGIVKARVQP